MNGDLLPDDLLMRLRRLYRDPDHGWLLGVCAGLADWLRVDGLIVRLLALAGVALVPVIVAPLYIMSGVFLPRRVLRHCDPHRERRFWSGAAGSHREGASQ